MTRSEFILLSDALRTARRKVAPSLIAQTGVDQVALEIARSLQARQPRFEVDRFLRDSGMPPPRRIPGVHS